MISFLESFSGYVRRTPEHVAVVDRGGERATSYHELDELSGRIASWLMSKGIGREGLVAIRVPRGLEFIATRLGVMKIGAAWVGTEALMGEERINYIIKDSEAAMVMDDVNYSEAMREEPLQAGRWADPDAHDLAFVYYTSGSTGRPKGVAQEYGIYEYIMSSTDRAISRWAPLDYANVAPETFIGGIDLMIGALDNGCTLHLIPLELVRNPAGLLKYFKEHDIKGTCMPPTLVKVLESAGGLDLKVLHVTGEILTDLYIDRFPMMNAYGPTEFAYLPFFFDIDRPYANTPIGTPDQNTRFRLLDMNRDPASREGELCIRLPFFRGYLHDADREAFVTIDGETYYKSGDYVSVDERGNVTIIGRVDDMVNINGNRIEPAEVEFAIKKVLNTQYAAVKAWERNGSRYLCAYHTTGRKLDAAEMAAALGTMLPGYMIPACYVSVDELPLNANGKVNKLVLPEPEDEILFAPYAPPEDELQLRLCEQFAVTLAIKDRKTGIDDDFFLLGGDSLAAIQLVVNMGDEDLTVRLIYKERTPRNIARALSESKNSETETSFNVDLEADWGKPESTYPLSEEQNYYMEQQVQMPDRIMYNLSAFLRFAADVDAVKLESAIRTAFAAHPSMLMVIRKTEDGWKQQYLPANNLRMDVEEVTEDEPEAVKSGFIKPFAFDGTPLFRRRLLLCGDRLYLLLDVHHIICDGESLRILIKDVMSAYGGQDIPIDHWFSLTYDKLTYMGSELFNKDRAYFEKMYGNVAPTLPTPDLAGGECIGASVEKELSVSSDEIRHAAKRLHLSMNAMYMLPAAIALSAYNNAESVKISWNYNGRSDVKTQRTVGLFLLDYPVTFDLKGENGIRDVCARLNEQLRGGILHGRVSPYMDWFTNDMFWFSYQGNILDVPDEDMLEDVDFPDIPDQAASDPMEFRIYDGDDGIFAEIIYDGGIYLEESVLRFIKIYEDVIKKILAGDCEMLRVADIRQDMAAGETI